MDPDGTSRVQLHTNDHKTRWISRIRLALRVRTRLRFPALFLNDAAVRAERSKDRGKFLGSGRAIDDARKRASESLDRLGNEHARLGDHGLFSIFPRMLCCVVSTLTIPFLT
jgi:hypothetical protein